MKNQTTKIRLISSLNISSIINLLLLFFLSLLNANCYSQGAAINNTGAAPDASAGLDIQFNNKGLLIPRMTTVERNAISGTAEGLQIFNTDTKCFEFYADGYWQDGICSFKCGIDYLTDKRDGNAYQTVIIGAQCWMKENLRYLPEVHNNSEFQIQGNNALPGYGVYGYDINNVIAAKATSSYSTYGVLYNWFAAIAGSSSSSNNPSGAQGICPNGWHLPSDDEWKQMEIFLGMSQIQADALGDRGSDEGGKLKAIAATYWNLPNSGATNSSGFTGLPGGDRSISGSFGNLSYYGFWWTATEDASTNVWLRYLYYNLSTVFRGASIKTSGFSVRCLKN